MGPLSLPAIGTRALRLVMTSNPVIVDRGTTLEEALERLESYGFRHLPVVEVDRVLGMLSERDLRLATGVLPGGERPTTRLGRAAERVADVMTQPVHCLSEDASLAEAVECMLRHDVGAIPVLQGHALIGIVTESDVLRLFVELAGAAGSAAPARQRLVPLPTVAPEATFQDALAALDPRGRHVAVVEDGALVGVVSERVLGATLARVARASRTGADELADLRVRDVMTTRPITAEPETPLWRCAGRMLDHKLAAVPVVAGNAPRGLVTQRGILAHFAEIVAREPDPGVSHQ